MPDKHGRTRRPFYAYTRAKKILSEQYLVAQGEHARREDATGAARVRPGAVPGTSLGWSVLDGPIPEPRPAHDSRYDAALRTFLRARGGRRRGRCPLGLHLEVNVTSRWIEEGGSLHDPANPRIRAHWDAVVTWAREAFGDALFALRIDLDETGGGVVDAFLSPLRRLRHKADSKAPSAAAELWISVNRAMEELTARFGHRRSENWAAINTSWAVHAKAHLDPRLSRGDPKSLTGRRHVPIDEIRLGHTALKAQEADLARQSADLNYRDVVRARTMATALAGRIGLDSAGVLAVRPAWAPAEGGPPSSPADDDVLRQNLQLIEKSHEVVIEPCLAFIARLLHLDRKRVVSAITTATGEATMTVQAASIADAGLEAQPDADDPFAVPDPTTMVPRLR